MCLLLLQRTFLIRPFPHPVVTVMTGNDPGGVWHSLDRDTLLTFVEMISDVARGFIRGNRFKVLVRQGQGGLRETGCPRPADM